MNARSRWLVRNNGYAANAIESWAANTVGDGISPNSSIAQASRKDAVQRLWLAWTDDADAEGLTDFYGLQRRAAREVFMTGEVFLRFRPRRVEDGLVVPLQVQILPSEMLPLSHNAVDCNVNVIRQGIELNRVGRRVAFHFLRRHPGDSTDPGLAGETIRVPASEVLHVIDPVEAGQLRGVSRFAPAIVKLFLLDQYDDAELDRKKVAAMYAMFVTSPAPDNPLPRLTRNTKWRPARLCGSIRARMSLSAPPPIPVPPMSRSGIALCCKSRRRWAFPMGTCPTTAPRATSRTRGCR